MTPRGPLVLATRNAGKLRELRPMFAAAGLDVIDLVAAGVPASPAEDGLEAFDSFEANALAKARHFHAATGLVAVADDSGLEVDALAGIPGVHSKRWCGRSDLEGLALDAANNAQLVTQLAGAGAGNRGGRYVCVAAAVGPGLELTARGEVRGTLVAHPRGTGGFGYDPFFLPDEGDGRTFAELSREEKEVLSHRGRAFAELLSRLTEARGRD